MTGELRQGSERDETCPSCGEWKDPTAALCRSCRDEQIARDARGPLPPAPFDRRNPANRDKPRDPAYGHTCPECGGFKTSFHARRCAACAGRGTSLTYTGRIESIITFRHAATGALRTLHCHGKGVRAQIADGLARLDGDGWTVETRSTPESILKDLKTETTGRAHTRNFRKGMP